MCLSYGLDRHVNIVLVTSVFTYAFFNPYIFEIMIDWQKLSKKYCWNFDCNSIGKSRLIWSPTLFKPVLQNWWLQSLFCANSWSFWVNPKNKDKIFSHVSNKPPRAMELILFLQEKNFYNEIGSQFLKTKHNWFFVVLVI